MRKNHITKLFTLALSAAVLTTNVPVYATVSDNDASADAEAFEDVPIDEELDVQGDPIAPRNISINGAEGSCKISITSDGVLTVTNNVVCDFASIQDLFKNVPEDIRGSITEIDTSNASITISGMDATLVTHCDGANSGTDKTTSIGKGDYLTDLFKGYTSLTRCDLSGLIMKENCKILKSAGAFTDCTNLEYLDISNLIFGDQYQDKSNMYTRDSQGKDSYGRQTLKISDKSWCYTYDYKYNQTLTEKDGYAYYYHTSITARGNLSKPLPNTVNKADCVYAFDRNIAYGSYKDNADNRSVCYLYYRDEQMLPENLQTLVAPTGPISLSAFLMHNKMLKKEWDNQIVFDNFTILKYSSAFFGNTSSSISYKDCAIPCFASTLERGMVYHPVETNRKYTFHGVKESYKEAHKDERWHLSVDNKTFPMIHNSEAPYRYDNSPKSTDHIAKFACFSLSSTKPGSTAYDITNNSSTHTRMFLGCKTLVTDIDPTTYYLGTSNRCSDLTAFDETIKERLFTNEPIDIYAHYAKYGDSTMPFLESETIKPVYTINGQTFGSDFEQEDVVIIKDETSMQVSCTDENQIKSFIVNNEEKELPFTTDTAGIYMMKVTDEWDNEHVLTAQYKKEKPDNPVGPDDPVITHYTIQLDSNGVSVATNSLTTDDNGKVTLPNLTRDGYTFKGWFTAQTGGTQVTNNTVFEEDQTLYAVWEKNQTPNTDPDPDDPDDPVNHDNPDPNPPTPTPTPTPTPNPTPTDTPSVDIAKLQNDIEELKKLLEKQSASEEEYQLIIQNMSKDKESVISLTDLANNNNMTQAQVEALITKLIQNQQADIPVSGGTITIVTKKDGSAVVKDAKTDQSSITVPAVITAKDHVYIVREIAKETFKNDKSVEKVNISAGITKIDTSAFEGCTKLKEVTIPETVKTIGTKAFANCTSLKKIVIPASVTKVNNKAYKGCKSVKSVVFNGQKVTAIGNSAFEGCIGIKSVTITKKVKTIGKRAFYGCKKLKTVKVESASLKKVGKQAFKKCKKSIKFKCAKKLIAKYKKLFKGKY